MTEEQAYQHYKALREAAREQGDKALFPEEQIEKIRRLETNAALPERRVR